MYEKPINSLKNQEKNNLQWTKTGNEILNSTASATEGSTAFQAINVSNIDGTDLRT